MANTNDQNTKASTGANQQTDNSSSQEFETGNQGQNLGGGSSDEKTISVGKADTDKEFGKTDQSISQAAPGQTATNNNQGGSNA